jgi:hypothetical protein
MGEYDNLEKGYHEMEINGVQEEETCPIKWLERFCNTDIHNCNLHVSEKVWIVIARCDGGSGQLLGQAVNTGLDGVRAWITTLVLYYSRYLFYC